MDDSGSPTITKYYIIAGIRVAMRDSGGNLFYFVTDHLGSTVALLDSSGTLDSDERYMPLGEDRDDTGISRTDYAFTGQQEK